MCVSVPCVYLSLTVSHCLSLSHASLHTHNPTLTVRHSLSLVLVVMMKSKEVKTSRSIRMLILWFSLIHCLLLPLPFAATASCWHCLSLFLAVLLLCCAVLSEFERKDLDCSGRHEKPKDICKGFWNKSEIKSIHNSETTQNLHQRAWFTTTWFTTSRKFHIYLQLSLSAPLSQLWDDFIKDYVTFRETTQNLHQEAWFTTSKQQKARLNK